MNEVYYRPMALRNGETRIACMQDFDECDYDHSLYLTDEKFNSEEEAQGWIDEQIGKWTRVVMTYLRPS